MECGNSRQKKPWVSLNGGVLYERGMGVENSYGIHPYDLM